MKAYKVKSLLYLFAFILSALLYHNLEASNDPVAEQTPQLASEITPEQPMAENF